MTDEKKTVLFMDDELGSSDVVGYAIEALREAGYEVDAADRMSVVLNAFYERYYHIFVTDIDMSLSEDHQEGDGTQVSRYLKSMDAETRVVNFSARGGPANWLAAANCHFFGYVNKKADGAVECLVRMVDEACATPPEVVPQRPVPAPKAVLVAVEEPSRMTLEQLSDLAGGVLPDWEVVSADRIAGAAALLRERPDDFGVTIVVCDCFQTRKYVRQALSTLCRTSYRPQAVFACEGQEANQAAILMLVNARPFRVLDTLDGEFPEMLRQSIEEAAKHYGRRELLPPDEEGMSRLRLELSEETEADLGLRWEDEDESDSLPALDEGEE